MAHYERHQISAIYGDMDEATFEAFAADIDANGFRNPTVLLYEGCVFDGWHRYLYTLRPDAKWAVQFEQFTGTDPVGYSESLNLHHRHLTVSQRAAIKVRLMEWKQRGRPAANKSARRAHLDSKPSSAATSEEMADAAHVSKRIITQAKAVEAADPELADRVVAGDVSVRAAYQQVKEADTSPASKSPTQTERLQGRVDELELERAEHFRSLEASEAEVAQLRGEQSEDEVERNQAWRRQQAVNQGLKAEVATWKNKFTDSASEARYWKKQAKDAGWTPPEGPAKWSLPAEAYESDYQRASTASLAL